MSSLQRASERPEELRSHAQGCTILVQLQKEAGVAGFSSRPLVGLAAELVNHILPITTEQLQLVVRTPSYRWHLRWARNYTALSVPFTGRTSTLASLTLRLIHLQLCPF